MWWNTRKREHRGNYGGDMFFTSWGRYWCISLKIDIPTKDQLSFQLAHVQILGPLECGKTWNDFLQRWPHGCLSNQF